jgi:membrane dipeptidase
VRTLILFLTLTAAAAAQPNPFVMDGHVHMINRQYYGGGDIDDHYTNGQVDLARIRKGGLNAIFFSLFASEEYYPGRFESKFTIRLMDLALRQIEKHRDKIEVALNASDLERISKSGRIAAFLDLEGGFDLDGDLAVLRTLYRMGLRSAMLPSHNYTNNFADSCCGAQRWHGINQRGREVIAEMNRLGMVINVAHGSNDTILQAVEASRQPVLFSHGGSRHVIDIPRSLSDEAAKKIAAKGGVVGLQFGNTFSNPEYYAFRQKGKPFGDVTDTLKPYHAMSTIEEVDRAVAKKYPTEPLPMPQNFRMGIEQLVAVIDHWVNLVGEDHVSLGSDFDGGPEPPRGMTDIADYSQMATAMQKKGYSDLRIRKIMGLNLLRLIREVTGK